MFQSLTSRIAVEIDRFAALSFSYNVVLEYVWQICIPIYNGGRDYKQGSNVDHNSSRVEKRVLFIDI